MLKKISSNTALDEHNASFAFNFNRKAKEKKLKTRVKTPHILQMEAVECGAAALSIVLAYYGLWVPLEEVRVACGVSRDGSKANKIVKAARTYGLEVQAYRFEQTRSLTKLALPLIVHWNMNHFLVVEGFSQNKVYLNDPAEGPRTVTWAEFNNSFTGIVLSMQPTTNFKKGGAKFSVIAALRKRIGSTKMALSYVILASLALILPGLLVPTLSSLFVDYYLVRGLKQWLLPLIIGLLLTATFRGILTWIKEYYLMRLETKLTLSMSSKFFWHILRLPIEYYFQRFAGEIGNRVAINNQVAYLISGKLASTALDVITAIFYGLLMFFYDPTLTCVAIVAVFLNLLTLRLVARRQALISRQMIQISSKMTGTLMDGLQTIETIKAGGREADFFTKVTSQQAESYSIQQRTEVLNQALGAVPAFLSSLTSGVILTLGGLRIIDGEMSIGMLVAFQSLMSSFSGPVNNLVALGSSLQQMEGSLSRLDDVLAYKTDPMLEQSAKPVSDNRLPKLSGHLELRNVTFGYSRLEPPLIEYFNLKLQPGSRVALVGASGSGKSTVAKLVSGLFEPWEGEILFDGKPRTALARTTITNSVAVVDQDIFLFEGSVRENLTLWNPTIPESQLTLAAKDACIHDEIASRSNAYSSDVSEGGTNFSGGQRQRLEIARVLSGNPVLLVLDEATSALDPITEKMIDENLRRRGCTCLIIAHRLSTIRDCDEIIVMEHGKIVQRGTHAQMKEIEGGSYAKLLSGQSNGETEQID